MNSLALNVASYFREWPRQEKIPSEWQLSGRKFLIDVGDQRRERMARLVAEDRLASLAKIGSCQNRGTHKEAPDKCLTNPLLARSDSLAHLSMYLLHIIQ